VRVRTMLATLCAFGLAALTVTQTASASAPFAQGLWSSSFAATATGCDNGFGTTWPRDANSFCWTQGGDGTLDTGVELGVKFQSSQPVAITGIRFYRVTPGTVTGHLWDGAGGAALATGTFSGTTTHAWDDLRFAQPVTIQPNHTYLASYHVPDLQYAVQFDFFAASGYTVGPITALSSPNSAGNGVYCYDNDPTHCATFPANTYRDSNYWVTPLWGYQFTGFYQPIDNGGTLNIAKAGSAIPVKFSLGGNQGLDIFKPGFPQVTQISCSDSSATDVIESTVTAGASGLQYDASADQYVYVWKTSSAWKKGSCAQFDLGLADGSSHSFLVQFK
jgi:hypothetical protein